jgi:hypothetical protein
MVRNILGVIAGFITGGIFVTLFEWIGHQIYPIPANINPSDMASLGEYVKNAPLGALISVIVAQSMGSFFGGLVTGLITIAKNVTAWIYAVLALIMAGLNAFLIPHPVWFVVISLLLPIPLALLGSRVSGMFAKSN